MDHEDNIDLDKKHRTSLRASLFGAFQLRDRYGAEILISNRRARALLAMLCLASERPFSRRNLSKLLWPGRFETQARASLRQCLLDLGKVLTPLGNDILVVTRNRVALSAGSIQTDLTDLENALANGQFARASEMLITIGTRPLLGQLHLAPAFEDWRTRQRQHVEQMLKSSVKNALTSLEGNNKLTDYHRLLDAWKTRDPSFISGTRRESVTRLAVLPFTFANVADDQQYFADGIVDELITSLSQVPQLQVAGRRSSFQLENSTMTSSAIAEALRVTHLVEGSIQCQGDDIRIHIQIIDGRSDLEIWTQRYDGTIENIFDLQEIISRAVTLALGTALDLKMQAPDVRKMTHNKEAYDLYLQGRALTARAIGIGILDTAIHLLEQALELDPKFAQCWTALAEAHVYKAVYTPCLDRLALSKRMAECARQAIALAPTQGHAHAMLGIHRWTKNDIVGALDLAFEAYRLEPHNPDVVIRLGAFLLYCGRTAEALPYIEAATDQDPVHGRNFALLSTAYLNIGAIKKAIIAGQRMADLGFPSLWLGVASAAAGKHELAVEQYRQTRLLLNTVIFPPAGSAPMSPEALDAFWLMAAKGVCSGAEEDRVQYCNMLEMLYATLPDKYDTTIVMPAIWMGHCDMVFKTIGKQITPANFFCLQALWADREPINQIRAHSEFLSFAQRIGLTAAWEKYGWPDLLPRPEAWSAGQ
jgi:TolB-like protein